MSDTSALYARVKTSLKDYEKSHNNQGFTLLEIMLTLAVIGILATVTVPKYQGIKDHYRLEGSAQMVAGQMRYAKQLAMDQRKKVGVGLKTNSVEVFELSTPPLLLQQKNLEPGISFTSASGALQDGAMSYIFFDPRGFTQFDPANPAGSAADFSFRNSSSSQIVRVTINAVTGKVVILW